MLLTAEKSLCEERQKTAFRKFKDKWGSRLRYKTDLLEETL